MKKILVIMLLILIAGCSQKKVNVVTMKSGLKYEDDTVGNGRTAKVGDLITIKFNSWIIKDNKNVYKNWDKDTSKTKDLIATTKHSPRPYSYRLKERTFIKGSYEGIAGMKAGGTRTIIIPSNLAYGKEGKGPVPPNTDIKLQVSLLKAIAPVKEWAVDSTKIKTTKDGLKYVIIEEGSGPKAKSGDVVTVDYSGFLLNGKKFGSSIESGKPITFKLGAHEVIPGWEEGIRLLNKGAKAELIIPPSLAYGSIARGPIPANSTLVFDIHLVDIK
jgi:peptidylprolyl isomerase